MSAEAEANKVAEALHELNVQTIVQIPKPTFDFSSLIQYLYVDFGSAYLLGHSSQEAEKNQVPCRLLVSPFSTSPPPPHRTVWGEGQEIFYIILTIFSYLHQNIIGLIPKPEILKPYTPTANINVTSAWRSLYLITHSGIWRHGLGFILAHALEPTALIPLLFFVVHLMGEFFKPLSLAIRHKHRRPSRHPAMLGLVLQYQNLLIAIPPLAFVIMTGLRSCGLPGLHLRAW